MVTITALDHVARCYTGEDGDIILAILQRHLAGKGTVTLSFHGVGDVTSSFVNSGLVPLLETMSFDDIRAKLRIVRGTRQINDMIGRCFRNALRVPQAA
ncbi:DUF4325 domain-containing protein [Sphingomonas naphthae]|uniref:DUF4325 domain-containing protein n=1 Tax=Sphingomonas naphthae TaxID=1813468 RepID=A0ABY7TQ38_9SPHN|nr:DUF4325 domain-containing protein [Sphingomonas naphthae]WCT75060.1 DUF4325 domain-containing protein [Sphingomonas naphthae]